MDLIKQLWKTTGTSENLGRETGFVVKTKKSLDKNVEERRITVLLITKIFPF